MKKLAYSALLLLPVMLVTSCNSKNNTLDKVNENTVSTFTGYTAVLSIKDGDTSVYHEENTLKIERSEVPNTQFNSTVTKLNTQISAAYPTIYNTEVTSYTTIGTTKYDVASTGITSEMSYVIPETFLPFQIGDKIFSDLESTKDKKVVTYTGKVSTENNLKTLFNGNDVKNISDFSFTLVVNDGKITNFDFTYNDVGDNISLAVEGTYALTYEAVVISVPTAA